MMKIQVFWDMMSCQLVERHSGGASCLHIQVQNILGSSNPTDGSSSLLLIETLANTVTQLSTVVPRKLRNYNFTRNNNKDSNGN